MDVRWGVCYAWAPDPDTTQNTAPQATTAVLECDLLQVLIPDLVIQVEGGGCGLRDANYRHLFTQVVSIW